MSVDKMSVDKMSVDKMSVDKMYAQAYNCRLIKKNTKCLLIKFMCI